jgi:hypothetical protein
LIDEPDAHLEILRQKQVYEILKTVASENACQVIIATHSEVILDDAVDTNLTLLLNGEAVNLANHQDMKNALRSFGIEHYYKARVAPRILYVEGSTDIEILKALAKKLEHPAAETLSGNINYYYTQNVNPREDLKERLDRAAGAFGNFRQHFQTLKRFVPNFRGIAVFDNDNRSMADSIEDDLAVIYWREYELENYFITPELLLRFAKDRFKSEGLFEGPLLSGFNDVVNRCLVKLVFGGDTSQLEEFHRASAPMKRTVLQNVKMSRLAQTVFETFANETRQPILLNKGQYYQLVQYVATNDIPNEIGEKLDLIQKYLSPAT